MYFGRSAIGVNDEFPPGQSKHSKRIIIQQRLLESDEDVSRRTQHTILMTASSIYHKLFPATPPEWRFRRHRVLGVLPQYFHAYIFGDWEVCLLGPLTRPPAMRLICMHLPSSKRVLSPCLWSRRGI